MIRCFGRFEYPRVSGVDFSKSVSLTQQHFKDDADINKIVEKFVRTGVLSSGREGTRQPSFGDFSNIDFQRSMEIVALGKSGFEVLPASIRAQFDNDVQVMLDFIADPANKDEAISLGLLADDSKNDVFEEDTTTPVVAVESPTTPNVIKPVAEPSGEASTVST